MSTPDLTDKAARVRLREICEHAKTDCDCVNCRQYREDARYALRAALDLIERQQAIIDRLPKTKDGVPVAWGDNVWVPTEDGPAECPITQGMISGTRMLLADLGYGVGVRIEDCYSTYEAAKEASDAS